MDPVTLQVMVGALKAACDEMGVVLVRSAHSANVKERRDASTGLFDASGEMVMQAEHIPVHLGAMPFAVAAVIGEEQRPGDAWILNDPFRGGMRNPEQRRADLRAQLAAGRNGATRVVELVERHGLDAVREAMRETLDYAERRTRARIEELEDGRYEARDLLEAPDGDLELRLRAEVEGDELRLDYSGSADQHDGNLNCPLAVTLSASYFAVRVLTDPDVPACAGAYRPVRVIAPEGSLLNARPPAAVVAGNVETSSRVADLVLAAFGRALGQGTMNNLTLGNERFTYYETVGGGAGGGAISWGRRSWGRRLPARCGRGTASASRPPAAGATAPRRRKDRVA